ncbi:MAG: hypothetical protein H7Z42_18090 [Roseiflexaceae bacterium]|nr:hypothetical protein [Roseiflexaceae bacterium]
MNRPRSYTIAAVLIVLYNVISLMFELPNLLQGPGEISPGVEGPPVFLSIINFTLLILGLVSAYGVWQVQKWGVTLALIVAALGILTGIPAIIFAPFLALRVIGVIGVIWSAAIIVLLLRPRPNSITA